MMRTDAPKSTDRSPNLRAIRAAILAWYDRNKRDLPWRRRPGDAYAQWVAEIMLQQTRVETVVPYYQRFLLRFPDVKKLAAARHQTVLKHWEGLGYYRRALHLHSAAKVVASQGEFPHCAEDIRKLPGIGEYTAAAIASIAFGEPVAAVDGNVTRVISRVFGITNVRSTRDRQPQVKAVAGDLISKRRPGDFNQALMDLGSGICTPQRPSCPTCPVAQSCVACREGLCDSIPGKNGKGPPKLVELIAAGFIREEQLLMRRRPRGGLWSGLWEVPCFEVNGEGAANAATRLLGKFSERVRKLGVVRHQLTHRNLVFHVYACTGGHRRSLHAAVGGPARWVDSRRLAALPVSTAHRKIITIVRNAGR